MPAKSAPTAPDLADSLLNAFRIHGRINEYTLTHLDPRAWNAPAPDGKGRNIAAAAVHIHNVRCMWIKAAAPDVPQPAPLDKDTATPASTIAALRESQQALETLIAAALASGGRIKNFKPDAAAFLGYLIAHDSHHRGQIAMLARQAGFPMDKKSNFGMWEWGVR